MSFLGLFDYPKEIKQLQTQLSKADRDAVMSKYKNLSHKNRLSFTEALHNADVKAASAILGKDLTQYHIVLNKATENSKSKVANVTVGSSQNTPLPSSGPISKSKTAITHRKHATSATVHAAGASTKPAADSTAKFQTSPTTPVINNRIAADTAKLPPLPASPLTGIVKENLTPTILPTEAINRYKSSLPSNDSAAQTKLIRSGDTGIFTLPDEITDTKIQSVLLNGKELSPEQYAITENGDVDVFEPDKNPQVTVVLKE